MNTMKRTLLLFVTLLCGAQLFGSHGFVSYTIPIEAYGPDTQVDASELPLTVSGYVKFFGNELTGTVISFDDDCSLGTVSDGMLTVDLAGATLSIDYVFSTTTYTRTAILQSDGTFTYTIGTDVPPGVLVAINVFADYTTAGNYNSISGGDNSCPNLGSVDATISQAIAGTGCLGCVRGYYKGASGICRDNSCTPNNNTSPIFRPGPLAQSGGSGILSFSPLAESIPTLGEWGLIILSFLMMIVAIVAQKNGVFVSTEEA